MTISQNAVAAREAARSKTGEFGHQQHGESGVTLATANRPDTSASIQMLHTTLDDYEVQQDRLKDLQTSVQFALAHQAMIKEEPEAVGVVFGLDDPRERNYPAGFVRADGSVIERGEYRTFLTPEGECDHETSIHVQNLINSQTGRYRTDRTEDGVEHLLLPTPTQRPDCSDLVSSIEADYEDDRAVAEQMRQKGILNFHINAEGKVTRAQINTDCWGNPHEGKVTEDEAVQAAQQLLDSVPNNTRTGIRWAPTLGDDEVGFYPYIHS